MNDLPVKASKNEVAFYTQDPMNIDGASDFLGESIDIRKIQQKKGPLGLVIGEITDTDNIQTEKIEFIWMGLTMSHCLFPKYDPNIPNAKPFCKAKNGQTPDSGTQMRPGPCSDCDEALWFDTKPPMCPRSFNMLCWDVKSDAPFIFSVKRRGEKKLRNLKRGIRFGKAKWGYEDIPTQCSAVIELTTIADIKEDYFLPEFKIVRKLPEDEANLNYRTSMGQIEQFKNMDVNESAEDEEPDFNFGDNALDQEEGHVQTQKRTSLPLRIDEGSPAAKKATKDRCWQLKRKIFKLEDDGEYVCLAGQIISRFPDVNEDEEGKIKFSIYGRMSQDEANFLVCWLEQCQSESKKAAATIKKFKKDFLQRMLKSHSS